MPDIQAVFIDRDGTIGGDGHFAHPANFKPYPNSLRAFALLKAQAIPMFAFTNQNRIAKGEATLDEFKGEFRSYGFDDMFLCPHRSEDNCICHKPRTGLLEKAAKTYHLDLRKTVVIGDVGATDMLAAHGVGAIKILVQTGWGQGSMQKFRHTWAEVEPDFVAEDLLEAVQWLVK
ncbi:HAD-IIIA family hydrolase [Aureibacillus halotolerans]|uniref:D,D-heptose 1,7-bisphosphate phosphatase n=1 Tax=Aureibacillus halotolerans TaxID=1508390 RepID=A0A4R6U4Y3_9BACI|nr:HAD-IIIA family hydrolase [Aureibacillus halotolerans]TDQ40786.1 histidinol-phosphate phosphatase family protein/HAD superfamily hydrolase (TIGR01662 family) [Aureibacillus halotolerans]